MAAQLRRPCRRRLRSRSRARHHGRPQAAHSKGPCLARDAKNRQNANKRRAYIGVERPKEQLDESACPQACARQTQNRGTARLNGRVGHKSRHQKPESQTADEAAHHRKYQARRAQLNKGGSHKTAQGACKIQRIKAKGSTKNGADATRHACRSPLASAGVARRDVISARSARSRTPANRGDRKGCKRRARKGGEPARIPTRVAQDGNRQCVDRARRHAIGKVKPKDNKGRLQADPKNRARWQRLSPSPSLCLVFFRHGVSPVDV